MRPVLFDFFGISVQSYGVSKAVAALAAAWLLGRAFARQGLDREHAHALALAATVWGFVGAKAYFLAENYDRLAWHQLGGTGFTWYGGFIGGTAAAVVTARRRNLPLAQVAGLAAAPLSLAYGIGRLGCLLAGDGTYGTPSSLPWAIAFPDGVVPTDVPVHPTPLYESLVAFALAALLWRLQQRWHPFMVVAAYLFASGLARILVEGLRTNEAVLVGLTQPQIWSFGLLAASPVLVALAARDRRAISAGLPRSALRSDPVSRPTGQSPR